VSRILFEFFDDTDIGIFVRTIANTLGVTLTPTTTTAYYTRTSISTENTTSSLTQRASYQRAQQEFIELISSVRRGIPAIALFLKSVVSLYTLVTTAENYRRNKQEIVRVKGTLNRVYHAMKYTYDLVQGIDDVPFQKIKKIFIVTSLLVSSNLLYSMNRTSILLQNIASSFTSMVRRFHGVWIQQDRTKAIESINYLYSGERPMQTETTVTATPTTTLYGDSRDEQDLTAVGDSIKVTKNPDRIIRVHLSSTAGSEDRI
jgi:hypothetical protein